MVHAHPAPLLFSHLPPHYTAAAARLLPSLFLAGFKQLRLWCGSWCVLASPSSYSGSSYCSVWLLNSGWSCVGVDPTGIPAYRFHSPYPLVSLPRLSNTFVCCVFSALFLLSTFLQCLPMREGSPYWFVPCTPRYTPSFTSVCHCNSLGCPPCQFLGSDSCIATTFSHLLPPHTPCTPLPAPYKHAHHSHYLLARTSPFAKAPPPTWLPLARYHATPRTPHTPHTPYHAPRPPHTHRQQALPHMSFMPSPSHQNWVRLAVPTHCAAATLHCGYGTFPSSNHPG